MPRHDKTMLNVLAAQFPFRFLLTMSHLTVFSTNLRFSAFLSPFYLALKRLILTIFSRCSSSSTPKMTELATRECTKMRLDSPQFHALFTPELTKLSRLFARNEFELRMAGGAVRDLLMGQKPAHVDFATDATPDQLNELSFYEAVSMYKNDDDENGLCVGWGVLERFELVFEWIGRRVERFGKENGILKL
jgi:hypothetical protein